MTKPREKKPEVVYPRLRPDQAHQLCQVDHIPRYLQGGQKVYCFNALDVVSHYPTGQVYPHRRASDARAFLSHVWQTIGIPHYTQVDNEACFSGGFSHPYVLGQCVRLALMVGTELVFSPVRHPQSNGTVERFHQDYQRHVWQDTYLADLKAVQSQADHFFELYRHSQHHTALKEETPTMVHQCTAPTSLDQTFKPPEGKLPLYAGQLHFIRQVQPDGTVSVLNVDWTVPNPDPQQGVWVTLALSPHQAILAIYNDAPDALERTCLVSYPFPIEEPVLSRSSISITKLHQTKPALAPKPEPAPVSSSPTSLRFGRCWPLTLVISSLPPTPHLVRTTLTRIANFVRNVVETMF